MARIRAVEIRNFRGIKALTWYPAPRINCVIGPGDGRKSSILDAIDWAISYPSAWKIGRHLETDRCMRSSMSIQDGICRADGLFSRANERQARPELRCGRSTR